MRRLSFSLLLFFVFTFSLFADNKYQFSVDFKNCVKDKLLVELITPEIKSETVIYRIPIIKIKNSGQLKENLDSESGFGIKNTQQRLHLLYGNSASLKISNQNSTSVLTELIIPKNRISYESNNN